MFHRQESLARSLEPSSLGHPGRPVIREVAAPRPTSLGRASALMSSDVPLSAPPCQLEIDRRDVADGVTLAVRGEIDLASAPALEHELRYAEGLRVRRIVLDLAGLDFIDSTGIHLLIDAQARAETNGHQLVVSHVPPHAQRVFELTGIATRLTIE